MFEGFTHGVAKVIRSSAGAPRGHFFVDQFPNETARILQGFLAKHR